MAEAGNSSNDGRIAFTYPDFSLYQLARFLVVAGLEMQSVAVGWQIYDITHRPLDLGLVGLAQFSAGHSAVSGLGARRRHHQPPQAPDDVLRGVRVCSSLLLLTTLGGQRAVYPHLRCGSSAGHRARLQQSRQPLAPAADHSRGASAERHCLEQLRVPGRHDSGPVAGRLYLRRCAGACGRLCHCDAGRARRSLLDVAGHAALEATAERAVTVKSVLAGLHYIGQKKLILGSISLDLFAVLLGGAVALLPVFASDILRTGPWGLGLLRASPAIGAGSMALLLAHRPFRSRAGATMLWCVGGFGAFTVLFGISRSLVLSMVALMLVGSMDMVSVVVRSTLVQLATPDEMRGRVNAVEMIFIGASNEIGQFESGLTAQWFGTVPAVIMGGVGTLIITALWAWSFPEIRRVEQLSSVQ